MEKRTTTVRMPEELAENADVVARGRGISVNTLILEALEAEIERARHDEEFMTRLRELTERDKEILDRLAE
ncbi:MAG TPA: toxin-antitoxin system HicB family antitoxin [Acidimicrobiia bacterium]|jgi:predicted DNA-binding protein